MLVTIEKYDIVKGVTYKRQFELDTDCVIFEKDGLTMSIMRGLFKELCILCRDNDNVNFISSRVIESISRDVALYHFDTIKYLYDNNVKILVRQGDEF